MSKRKFLVRSFFVVLAVVVWVGAAFALLFSEIGGYWKTALILALLFFIPFNLPTISYEKYRKQWSEDNAVAVGGSPDDP